MGPHYTFRKVIEGTLVCQSRPIACRWALNVVLSGASLARVVPGESIPGLRMGCLPGLRELAPEVIPRRRQR